MKTDKAAGRLLIFVIAYCAESTIHWVLDRIPRVIFDEYDCEILVVDDGSPDRTFELANEYRQAHPELRITALRNEINQGYGGNQKVGYTYAIEEKFDYVAMVHGDGQYAPEELPRLVAPLRDGTADAIFGSRMLTRFGALKGGMPFYKYVGNKVLTTVQNTLLGTRLSEFHSGYRLYTIAALQKIAFTLNTNDFHFDTEIILQLLNARQRIGELPIPTYYGDEICRVNGMRYARDVVIATTKNWAHRMGVFHQRRFQPVKGSGATPQANYGLKLGYPSSHTYALEAVPPQSKVLDIGAGPGACLAGHLLDKGCQVAVVDPFQQGNIDSRAQVVEQDLNQPLEVDFTQQDVILLLDIIEHVKSPEEFLDAMRTKFDWSTKTLILSTPNIAFIAQRIMLALGQFNYGVAGILDKTHTRLFTFRTVKQLLLDAGFRIKEVRGVPAPFPKAIGRNRLANALLRANLFLIGVSKKLFSYQIFIVAESTPDINFILGDAKRRRDSSLKFPGAP